MRAGRRPPGGIRTRRGIFLLPAVFTVANIFCGFYAIAQSFRGEFASAAFFIGFAILADLIDGRVARFAAAESDFGRELDSLADMCSFGIAPAVLVFAWSLHALPRAGWLVAALFAICAALRLARFNVGRLTSDPGFYAGLPSPAAGAVIGATVAAFPEAPAAGVATVASLFGTLALGLLMNAPVRYLSFKALAGRRPQSPRALLLIAVVFVAAIAEPVAVYLFLSFGYATHPAVRSLARVVVRPFRSREQVEPERAGRSSR